MIIAGELCTQTQHLTWNKRKELVFTITIGCHDEIII